MKRLSIKTIVAIGIGAAVFFVLAKFVAIPTGIPNTTIQTSYAFLALMSVIFGPIAGGLIGLIGHALNDAFSYGTIWWSWVAGSALVGLFIGLFSKRLNVANGEFGKKQIISFNIIQAIVQLIVWFVPPVLDVLIYSEPANKVIAQALFAGISNIITVGIIGTILLAAYAKTRTKSNSLTKE